MGRRKELESKDVDEHGVTQSGHYLSIRSDVNSFGKCVKLKTIHLEDGADLEDYKRRACELSLSNDYGDGYIVIKGAHGRTVGAYRRGEYISAAKW